MEADIDGNREGLGETWFRMSGVDEQDTVFSCFDCGETKYWVLRGWNEVGGDDTLLGFLNNPNMSEDPALEIMSYFEDWFLHAILRSIKRIYCDDCRDPLPPDGHKWKKVLNKIEALWEGRVIV